MTSAPQFDARAFGQEALAYTTNFVTQTDLEDILSFGWYGSSVDDPDAEAVSLDESPIDHVYAYMGAWIVEQILDDSQENTELVVEKLNALLACYSPSEQRWQSSDYESYDDFWSGFREDFAWGDWMAEKIIKLEDPSFPKFVNEHIAELIKNAKEENEMEDIDE